MGSPGLLLLALLFLGSGCAETPRRVALETLRLHTPSSPSEIAEKAHRAEATTTLVTEVLLRPIGLEKAGEGLLETQRFLRREVVEPLDRLRRFKIGGFRGAIEVDVDEDLAHVSVGISLRF